MKEESRNVKVECDISDGSYNVQAACNETFPSLMMQTQLIQWNVNIKITNTRWYNTWQSLPTFSTDAGVSGQGVQWMESERNFQVIAFSLT